MRFRKPAWTRRSRIDRLNYSVLYHLPRWTQENVDRFRAAGEKRARDLEWLLG